MSTFQDFQDRLVSACAGEDSLFDTSLSNFLVAMLPRSLFVFNMPIKVADVNGFYLPPSFALHPSVNLEMPFPFR